MLGKRKARKDTAMDTYLGPGMSASYRKKYRAARPVAGYARNVGSPHDLYNSRGAAKEELKFVDTATASLGNAGAGVVVTLLNGITQGIDYNQRIGRKISMKSVYARILYAGTVLDYSRWIIFYDLQSNGAAPVATDLLVSADVFSANNLNNRDRFIVIMDKVLTISPNGQTVIFRKKYKRLNTEVHHIGITNGVASIATGALYLLTIDTSAVATSLLQSLVRVRYTDA